METERSSETSVNFFRITRRYNPEDSHSCGNFESNTFHFCPLAAAIFCVTHQHTQFLITQEVFWLVTRLYPEMVETRTSETTVTIYQISRCHIPEDSNLHSYLHVPFISNRQARRRFQKRRSSCSTLHAAAASCEADVRSGILSRRKEVLWMAGIAALTSPLSVWCYIAL
jgi:hypothetical protein